MSSDNRGSQPAELAFARTLGLFDATMIGVGAMIGAGIFVLTGIAAGVSGPASILAFALNGAVREPIFQKVLFGEISEKVARYSPASVLVVKQYEGNVRSMFKRMFG